MIYLSVTTKPMVYRRDLQDRHEQQVTIAGPQRYRRWTGKQIWQRAVAVLREEGITNLWFKILGETVYRRVIVVEHRLGESIRDVISAVPFAFGLLTKDDIEEYLLLRPEADPVEVYARLDGGQLCFVTRHDGKIGAVNWVATTTAWIDYLSLTIPLAPEEVYAYESFTAPELRGQNVAPARSVCMLRYLEKLGYRRVIGVITPENMASLRYARKSGYHPIGTMGYIKVGRWQYNFCRLRPGVIPLSGPQHEQRISPSSAVT